MIVKTKEWYHYLLTQWKLIVLAGIIGGILGVTYSFIKKPVYTATLTFALEDEKAGGGLGGALGLASTLGIDLGTTRSMVAVVRSGKAALLETSLSDETTNTSKD